MSNRDQYKPGPARGARVDKDGNNWTLVLVRDLRHAPERVWSALTEPEHLRAWAPFDADASMARTGAKVQLTTVGAPSPMVDETTVTRADATKLLEYTWGGKQLRWQLEPLGEGTRLTLWHNIERGFITWGAAGWHICFDVLDQMLAGTPLGRMVGADAMKYGEWQRLVGEYANEFDVEPPKFAPFGEKS